MGGSAFQMRVLRTHGAFLGLMILFLLPGQSHGQQRVSSQSAPAAAPTATIFSNDSEVCLGSSVTAYLYFSGDGPWDAVVSDKDGVYRQLNGVTSPHAIQLTPTEDNVYKVTHVEDRFGITGNTYGEVALFVYDPTPVTIQMDRTSYLYTEPGVQLKATPSGGTFTGNGVAGSYFYPGIATPVGSPHKVTYTYYNQYGCRSTDEAEIHVLYGEGEVLLLSGEDTIDNLCDDGRTYLIRGSNKDNLPGLFGLKEAGTGNEVSGHITDEDPGDDLAILDPSGLEGMYDIEYTYGMGGLSLSETYRFQVNNLESITVPDLPETVCSSDEPYLLIPDQSTGDPGAIYQFSGPGVSGNQAEGFYFDPGSPDVTLGELEIRLEYSASNGCSAQVVFGVTNRYSPDASFVLSPICLPGDGGWVEFQNLTGDKNSIESWEWDFGDPDSGSENSSTEENPSHFYASPGPYQIRLTATSTDGCVAVHNLDTILADQPAADFAWLTDCFVSGKKIAFVDRTVSEYAEIDSLMWTFRTADGGVLGTISTHSSSDTVRFPFTRSDSYKVDLYVQNEAGCEGAAAREIDLQPVIKLTESGYREEFNGQQTRWFAGSEGTGMSWRLEEPDFTGFQQVAGDYAWFTVLPEDSTEYLEVSWVQSPCFDFSTRKHPLIHLDLMKSLTPGYDGAVLQYRVLDTEDWVTIGAVGEGVNWYNVTDLAHAPGGDTYGWGLPVFEPDKGWVNASHDLDLLAGLPLVKIRFLLATGGQGDLGNQGIAFDNIYIGDRIRRSVLEHFTNTACMACVEADTVVDHFALSNPGYVFDLQFHTDFPGFDPMNNNNPTPSSTRIFNYGIQGVPYAILNGGVEPGTRYDFSGPGAYPNDEVLQEASLEIPEFDLNLQVQWLDNSLQTTTTVTCLADTFTANIVLYLAVIETSVTSYTGENQDTSFRNVVLDMLPTPAGKFLANAWSEWMSETRNYTWEYPDYVEDVEELAVVAFIQNRDTREILQAAARYLTPQVGIRPDAPGKADLVIYPNPATDEVYVRIDGEVTRAGNVRIIDLTGKTVSIQQLSPGNNLYRFDLKGLPRGLYLLWWEESGVIKGRGKLIGGR
jgi:PKD repeat protein